MSDAPIDVSSIIQALTRMRHALPPLVAGIAAEHAAWRPPDAAWSIVEIVCHLADEEAEDFRVRVQSTLEQPQQQWPPIDPEGWALQRNYRQADLAEAAERFVRQRQQNLQWLSELGPQDWQTAHVHPQFGPIRAGDLLASWAAHDALHLRQIAKRMFQLTSVFAPDFPTRYAGQW